MSLIYIGIAPETCQTTGLNIATRNSAWRVATEWEKCTVLKHFTFQNTLFSDIHTRVNDWRHTYFHVYNHSLVLFTRGYCILLRV
jgi:hypothetical protein